MDSTDIKDKLVLDPSDTPNLGEYFSRCEPGQRLGKIEIEGAIFEEYSPKVIVISLSGDVKITLEEDEVTDTTPDKGKKKNEAEGEPGGQSDQGERPEPASVTMYKEGGVSAGENNIPVETQPIR